MTVAKRANFALEVPADTEGVCCGMPFSSKGYTQAYKDTLCEKWFDIDEKKPVWTKREVPDFYIEWVGGFPDYRKE